LGAITIRKPIKSKNQKGGINHEKEQDENYYFELYKRFPHRILAPVASQTGEGRNTS